MFRHLHLLLSVFPLITVSEYNIFSNTLTDEQYRALLRNKAHRYRHGHHRRSGTTAKYGLVGGTSYVPFNGMFSYNHDPGRNVSRTRWTFAGMAANQSYTRRLIFTLPGETTTFNPYVDYNMPNFPFHLYETNPYLRDAKFNVTFPTRTGSSYTTTENVLILYDDILKKKLSNHRARLFNGYDQYFPILFKRAWKYAVGALFFDNCDSRNQYFFPKANLTRSESIYIFYEFLKKVRQSLKEVLSFHFHQIPDHSEDIVFTREKSINDVRHAFYTIENFISYDSNDIDDQWWRDNTTTPEYARHIRHVNEKLQEVLFPFVERRYFNFLKNFKYPAAQDETIIFREQIGNYLNKLCYKVVREIRSEKFFLFHTKLRTENYTSADLEVIAEYQKIKAQEEKCETCEEREFIRNKKKNRIR